MLRAMSTQADAIADVLARRFKLDSSPTLAARTLASKPVAFTRLHSAVAMRGRSLSVPEEDAFALQVPLSHNFFTEIWTSGGFRRELHATPGDVYLFDLSCNPRVGLGTPFDTLRCYVSQSTLDELAADRGLRRVGGLTTRSFGARDPLLYSLAKTIVAALEAADTASTLFVDHLALAFCSHVTHQYGGIPVAGRPKRGALATWQLRRAQDFIDTNLAGDPSITQLARECGLSTSHFARAFRQTLGMPPHQWLTNKRIGRAKELLQGTELDLAAVAAACGFGDQSHLTRVFTRKVGLSPGRWRRHARRPS
jgi:AraC family transcriptional regulator